MPSGNEGEFFEAHGSLEVKSDASPEATAHGDFPDLAYKASHGGVALPQRTKMSFLTGRLANGPQVILLDVKITYWTTENSVMDSAAAIITMFDTSQLRDPRFTEATFQVGGLDAVAGTVPMPKKSKPSEGFFGTWSLDIVETKLSWSIDGVTLSVNYQSTIQAFDPYSFTASFSPVVRLQLDRSLSFRDMIDTWVIPIRRIISVVTGRPEPLTYLSMDIELGDDTGKMGEVYGSGISQNPYDSTDKSVRKTAPALQFSQDDISLLDLVSAWRKLSDDHHPIMETYGTMLHVQGQHPRSRFLLLIQALEGAYGSATREIATIQTEKFQAARTKIIDLVSPCLNSRQRGFIKSHLRKSPPTNLNNVFSWLEDTLGADINSLIEDTALIKEVKESADKPITVDDAVRTVRNDLSHGSRGYDPHALYEVDLILNRILRALTLQLLGCPDEVVARVLAPPN